MQKDEIKEILDYFKKYVNDKYETYTVVDIHTQNLRTLLYYITNLQDKEKLEGIFKKYYEDEVEKNKRLQDRNIELVLERDKYKSRNEKANALLDEMLESAYIDGEYIMYDYSTSELLEVKQALQGEDKDE